MALETPNEIRHLFSEIAPAYDKANSVLSLGIHHLWRHRLVKLSGVRVGQSVLDCATGTGDLALEFKKAVGPSGTVVGSDFCKEMLATAPRKAQRAGVDIRFEVADVTALPYASHTFDFASISFGIRNVPDRRAGISELHRVVKPGGKVLILEFGQPSSRIVSSVFTFYSEKVLPKVGGMLSGKPKAYKYLQETSAKFPCRENFLDLMRRSAKFESVEYHTLSMGVAYIYMGTVA